MDFYQRKTPGEAPKTPPGFTSSTTELRPQLLNFSLCASVGQLLENRIRVGLRYALLHSLGRTVDEVFRLLEAKARDLAHRLDDVHLVVANGGEHHGELGLLLGFRRTRRGAGGRRRDGHCSGRGDAELLFHVLDELREL